MARPSIRNSPHLVQAPATTTTANLATTKDLDPSSLPDEEVDSSFLPFSLSLSFNPPHTKPIPTATARATVRAQKEQKSTDKQTNRQAMPSTPATTAAPAAAAPTPPTASSSTSSAPTGGRGGGGGAGRYRGGSSRGSGSGGGGSYGKLTESVRSLSVFDVGVGLERRELYCFGLIFVVAARRFACLPTKRKRRNSCVSIGFGRGVSLSLRGCLFLSRCSYLFSHCRCPHSHSHFKCFSLALALSRSLEHVFKTQLYSFGRRVRRTNKVNSTNWFDPSKATKPKSVPRLVCGGKNP